ncbi:MAG: metallophosphoesterase [Methanobacterium sp.]|uniref:metallophosphoesterase n=1 Tax=Methanobacterium sp. TaxID=2164 RepID=UPI003D6561D9|nr:metallophosphoesterase [Methanobacterium sp.]
MYKKIVLAVVIIIVSLLAYSLIEPYFIETKDVVIESNQIPAEFDGTKIVFLSDIHCGSWPFFDEQRTENLVNQVNALNPDLIVLGGDYVSDDSQYINPCFLKLSKLKAPLGVYGILGNNDPKNESINAMKIANITYIDNKGIWIEKNNSKIRLGGVGDYITDDPAEEPTINNVSVNDFVMLLSHNPDFFPKVDKSKVDLVLSGHTHGGQITFFGLWAPITHSEYGNKYMNGLKKEDNATLIVSNGIGTIILPARFFAKPQIILIELKRK